MRRALGKRIQAEREAIAAFQMARGSFAAHPQRFEEAQMVKILKDVPSIFAFAEQEGKGYMRPAWASQRWGAR
jgi:hypothetical protein